MTFQAGTWAVDGNLMDASIARLTLQAILGGRQGVVNATDCQVQATGPATSGVIITPGGVAINGAESSYQGAYSGWNVGNDTSLTIAATAGTPRSDMVVIRAEDPTWSGSPWGNPAAGQIIFPRVLSNVGSGAVTPPGGYSCIPLARIDMPASASVVQSSYINDLRAVANPQRTTVLLALAGTSPGVNSGTSSTTPSQWPAGASWPVAIPASATSMIVMWSVNEVTWNGDGNGNVRGLVNVIIGSSVTAPVVTTPQSKVTILSAQGPYRHTFGGGATVAIPASIRGTTQTIQFAQIASNNTDNATLSFGDGSSVTLLVQFAQLASAS